MNKPQVFLDANLFSIFTELNRLNMLIAVFDGRDLHVSPSVQSELVTAVNLGKSYIQQALDLIGEDRLIKVTSPSPTEVAQLASLPNSMDKGEAECIVVCQARGWTFASFDRKATNYCQHHDIPCLILNDILTALWLTGTATRDEVRQVVKEIEQSGRRIRRKEEIFQEE